MDKQHTFHRSDLVRIAIDAMKERGLEPEFPPRALQQLQTIDAAGQDDDPRIRDLTAMPWCSIDTDDFHRHRDHHRNQQHQSHAQSGDRQAFDLGQFFVHGDRQQWPPQRHQQDQHRRAAAEDPRQISRADRQQVAEQIGHQVDPHFMHEA